MTEDLLRRLAMFVVLCLAQVLILNHIHLFGVAIPLLYIYFVITFRRGTSKWMILLWGFFMGLTIDVFASTPGLAAFTLTLIAFLQPYWLELFVPRDSAENMEVSVSALGLSKYVTFSGALVLLYCILFFALEAFNFFNVLMWLEHTVASSALTMLLIIAIESVRSK